MNKIQKFAFIASVSLALALTISCSSDDDKGGDYLTCSEAEKVLDKCYLEFLSSSEDIYGNCMEECAYDEDCYGNCVEDEFYKCFDKEGFCGGNSREQCKEHYDTECGFEDDEDEE